MILLADSGSTKVDWRAIKDDGHFASFRLDGFEENAGSLDGLSGHLLDTLGGKERGIHVESKGAVAHLHLITLLHDNLNDEDGPGMGIAIVLAKAVVEGELSGLVAEERLDTNDTRIKVAHEGVNVQEGIHLGLDTKGGPETGRGGGCSRIKIEGRERGG